MKLTKEQKEELEKNYYKRFPLTSLSDQAEWWTEQLEYIEAWECLPNRFKSNPEPKKDTNSQVSEHSEKEVCKEEICLSCGGTGIYKYPVEERQEKCEHKDPFRSGAGTCRECGKHYTEPERIEELKEWKASTEGLQEVVTEMTKRDLEMKAKIQELIKAVNKLNNN